MLASNACRMQALADMEGCQLSELLRQLSMPNPATRRAGRRID